jgi:Tol biopolymer transport system component
MSWFGRASRWAAVASAAFLIAATATADASRGRLKAMDGAYWVAHGQLIAFAGWYGHSLHPVRLWMMNADGSGRRPVTGDAPAAYDLPLPSPSGRRLAASGDTGTEGVVFVSRVVRVRSRSAAYWLSGKLIRKFTIHVPADGYGPVAWAPDERALAVEVSTDEREMIFVADFSGSLRLVSRILSRDDESAAWSPDGRLIAFVTCAHDTSNCNLALIGRDGTQRKVIVRIDPHADEYEVQPVWAPNGRAIAFAARFGETRHRKATRLRRAYLVQRYGIYVVRPDGSALRRVAATPYMDADSFSAPALAWSPDSRRIAFVDTRGITIVGISDRSQHRLTSLPRDVIRDNALSWAPSTRVLFSNRGNLYTALPGQRPLRILP